MPSEVKCPNATTREAMNELESGKGKQFSNVDALMVDLEKGAADRQAGHVDPMDLSAIKAEGRARLSKPTTEDVAALKMTGEALDKVLQSRQVDVDEVVTQFKWARKRTPG